MFNEDLTLGDFVCPIAICSAEADLGSLIRIFQQNSCDHIAIFSEEKSWATISARILLVKLGELLQNQGFATVSHPRHLANQKSSFNLKIQDFTHLFEPANLYFASTSLSDFLQNSETAVFSASPTEYLIVDSCGELKGRLNKSKLLGYLASWVNDINNLTMRSIQTTNDFIHDVIDSIDSPLKVETATGQTIYANRSWQESFAMSDRADVPLLKTEIVNWWIRHKHPKPGKDKVVANHNQTNKVPIDFYNTLSPSDFALIQNSLKTFKLKSENSPFSNHCAASNILPTDTFVDPREFSWSDIQIEQKRGWNQIKIPLALTEDNTASNADSILFWLVLAIKTEDKLVAKYPSARNIALEDIAITATPQKIVTELINTISHELKSPLTGIIGLSSLLKDQQLGKLTQRQTLYTQLINNSSYKLMGIVNDLLELQEVVDSNILVGVESFDLMALCRQVYGKTCEKFQTDTVTESDFSANEIQLKLEIEPEFTLVTTNKRSLAAILSHLLLEIFQFIDSASNSSASKNIPNVTVQVTQESQQIAIVISNGNSLLDSFFLSSTSPKTSKGWNLTLAKYLVQGIEGSIKSHVNQDTYWLTLQFPDNKPSLSNRFSPSENQKSLPRLHKTSKLQPKNITILCLYPEIDVLNPRQDNRGSLDFNLKDWAEKDLSNIGENPLDYQYRIIEADGLEQAHTLARIWKLDVIIIDGYQINEPSKYLRTLQQSTYLAAIPLITLDTRTTEAANLVEGLNIYPCLLPAECRSVKDLMQVIYIATGLER